jgi:hypothetical protein
VTELCITVWVSWRRRRGMYGREQGEGKRSDVERSTVVGTEVGGREKILTGLKELVRVDIGG